MVTARAARSIASSAAAASSRRQGGTVSDVEGFDWLAGGGHTDNVAVGASLPDAVSPMLATAGVAPSGVGWACEWKWDGVRAIVAAAPGSVRATSRNDRDITAAYPELGALGELVDRPVLVPGSKPHCDTPKK